MADDKKDKVKLTPQQRLEKIDKKSAKLAGKPGSEEKLGALADRKKKVTAKLGKTAS